MLSFTLPNNTQAIHLLVFKLYLLIVNTFIIMSIDNIINSMIELKICIYC